MIVVLAVAVGIALTVALVALLVAASAQQTTAALAQQLDAATSVNQANALIVRDCLTALATRLHPSDPHGATTLSQQVRRLVVPGPARPQ